MKKCLPIAAGIVLGLLFVMASVMFFLKLGPKPDFPAGSPIAMFMGAFGPTGYMHFPSTAFFWKARIASTAA